MWVKEIVKGNSKCFLKMIPFYCLTFFLYNKRFIVTTGHFHIKGIFNHLSYDYGHPRAIKF